MVIPNCTLIAIPDLVFYVFLHNKVDSVGFNLLEDCRYKKALL